ncbi:MAG: excinuclease ABC subunit UvrA, partial [Verrucomicrobiales bacterium]|nr:excinuclease ABC subunit UvrA [Verrucomicrobiales bacterium]
GDLRGLLEKLRRQGFIRVRIDGELHELEADLKPQRGVAHTVEVVVDRIVIRDGGRGRLMDSIETALRLNEREIGFWVSGGEREWPEEVISFTTAYANPRTGFLLEKLTPRHFSFNTHVGACPHCQGVGTVMAASSGLLVPDAEVSLKDGAVKGWWGRQPKLKAIFEREIEALARHFDAPLDVPFRQLPEAFKKALFGGTGTEAIATGWKTSANKRSVAKPFEGLLERAERLYASAESETLKARLARLMAERSCPVCHGQRLRPECLAVRLASEEEPEELSIHGFCELSIERALQWMTRLRLTEHQLGYATDLRQEVVKRLEFLERVGLGYLALNRRSGTLSGGETQRIRLGTQIGAGLTGVLYVLDEPSIGLHPADTERLIRTLRGLRDLGNSVLVVEHDEAVLRAADHLVELGPGAGPRGGELIAQGSVADLEANEKSLTGAYLSGRVTMPVPQRRMPPRSTQADLLSPAADEGWLTVHGAMEHNLQSVTAAFPLGCLTCVTGPSGSGKSTLVDGILMRALARHFYGAKEEPGAHDRITGLSGIDKVVVVDQSPIGRSPRSNPATFTGAFGPIRDVFAQLPLARVRGYGPGRFSFNVAGGRCEKCQGDGQLKIDMHFLADVYVTCDQCGGHRYNAETLEVTFKGRSIAEVLDMTVAEAVRFFGKNSAVEPKLRALEETGLGYLRLGQSGTALSGGEAQRVKLAAELGKKSTGRTLYLLDEPTTGLHFADIEKLMKVLLQLRDAGNTIVVIEHNLDVMRCADWLLDLGPGGGTHGGQLVAQGTPEQVAAVASSATGHFLRGSDRRSA